MKIAFEIILDFLSIGHGFMGLLMLVIILTAMVYLCLGFVFGFSSMGGGWSNCISTSCNAVSCCAI